MLKCRKSHSETPELKKNSKDQKGAIQKCPYQCIYRCFYFFAGFPIYFNHEPAPFEKLLNHVYLRIVSDRNVSPISPGSLGNMDALVLEIHSVKPRQAHPPVRKCSQAVFSSTFFSSLLTPALQVAVLVFI